MTTFEESVRVGGATHKPRVSLHDRIGWNHRATVYTLSVVVVSLFVQVAHP